MITDRKTFSQVEELLSSDGWKLFQVSMENRLQTHLSKALKAESDREVAVEMTKYKTIREVMQGVYGDYKSNYNKYKGDTQ